MLHERWLLDEGGYLVFKFSSCNPRSFFACTIHFPVPLRSLILGTSIWTLLSVRYLRRALQFRAPSRVHVGHAIAGPQSSEPIVIKAQRGANRESLTDKTG